MLGAAGTQTVVVSVSDGALNDSASFTWQVLQQNFAPQISNPGAQTTPQDGSVDLLVNATDANGDTLTFGASGLPTGLSIDPASGRVTGVASTAGSFSATLSVSDGQLGDSVNVAWTVTPPVLPINIEPLTVSPVPTGVDSVFDVTASGTGPLEYSWSFGDGTPATDFAAASSATHQYATPGRYVIAVTVRNAQETQSLASTQAVYDAPTATAPQADTTIIYDAVGDLTWNVNPDNDSVTVIDTAVLSKVAEIGVGDNPVSLAAAGDEIWVVARDAARIDRIDAATRTVIGQIDLPHASRPYGLVVSMPGNRAYVALEALGEIAVLDVAQASLLARHSTAGPVRHLALEHTGARLFATRFITPPLPGEDTNAPQTTSGGNAVGGEMLVIDTATGSVLSTVVLPVSFASVSEHSGPGLPNYLRGLVIAPDGASGWVPSKQDNVLAGRARSGVDLTHDHTVRAISSKIDLAALDADLGNRVDHDNASIARSAAYGAYGSYLYVALEGNRMIAVLDAYRGEELFRFAAGRAPTGVVAAADGRRLFVHNYMDRTVTAHDLSALLDSAQNSVGLLGSVSTVASEALAANVLQGKRLFNDALDPRLTLESYMSCASCHADGDDDGRVWDFTQFGEGHRNTISLVGHGQHGPVHWTGNFDEIQDFEGQIRDFARVWAS